MTTGNPQIKGWTYRQHNRLKHRTSIGQSDFSRPKNKHKRRIFKRLRGQGSS